MAEVEDEGPLKLKYSFFGGTKFSLSGSEEKSVFGFFGGLKPEYKEVVSSNEKALQLANSAWTLRTVGNVAGFGLIIYGIAMEGLALGEATNNFDPGFSGVGENYEYMIAGLVVSLVFRIVSMNKIKKSVVEYNSGVKNAESEGTTVSMISSMPSVSPKLSVQGTTLAQVLLFSW
ncbi:MAG: hypothetical protein GY780_03815 [bacterium]|nr:hypothetical protein [bacterium]